MPLKKLVDKILKSNANELRLDLAELKKKTYATAKSLAEVYGEKDGTYTVVGAGLKKFKTSTGFSVGGVIILEDDYLEIQKIDVDVENDDEPFFPFDKLDVEIQISILDEIVKIYTENEK